MKKILIEIDTSRASGRKFLAGVERYCSNYSDWQVLANPPAYVNSPAKGLGRSSELIDFDGLLIYDPSRLSELLEFSLPKVILDTQIEYAKGESTIAVNSFEVGRIAAEYFIGKGFHNFAYCGFPNLPWSGKRFEGFCKILADKGIAQTSVGLKEFHHFQIFYEEIKETAKWLADIPKPVGIFTCNDDRAVYILEACKIAGIEVPEQAAVLGVDNDELVCRLSSPSLSSIELNFENAGFKAAEHLEELIENKVNPRIININPVQIIERQSTNVFAVENPIVQKALIYIRHIFKKPITVQDVAEHCCTSRRTIERLFRKHISKSVKSEIRKLRIELIKNKLLNTDLPAYQIANDLEFCEPDHLSRYFKKATGETPAQFRKNNKKLS
ncbi:Xylose operon regulatory protein [Sedimentisphaera cyanobacteriorum]|uniref:Xylose operon regulatory protein n=1 Tax=Sedimentisphaera cyanobacteriorum TaxID=1940790 RepID=A0A1Q2HSB0_9BACT|nr:DNA-binding transcriptional regulator [Sedimentisphaera cyanobacteriorum]AQQ10338.1 Xylose operon regulatory protein [Sedimentisphaera cyanobacteriorum]